MKKKLESELVSIAHRILKLAGKEDINKMHREVSELYEKLTVLKFAQDNFEKDMPTIANNSSFFEMLDAAFNNKISDTIEVEDKIYINLDDKEDDGIMEPVMEKIKDMVAEMPEEAQHINTLVAEAFVEEISEYETFETLSTDFAIPEFEPINTPQSQAASSSKTSLNDKLKGNGLHIGLNDKLAFIKHLFDNKSEDYDRVISQINTLNTFSEAQKLIFEMVKPDYHHWEGKAEYEERFLQIIEDKFS